jgi:cation diffusion facilitator family transporter
MSAQPGHADDHAGHSHAAGDEHAHAHDTLGATPASAKRDEHRHAGDHRHAEHRHDDGAHESDKGHQHKGGVLGFIDRLGLFHSHSHGALAPDLALESSAQGIRAVQISLVVLAITAALQVVVYLASGSVALLADTIHNFTDAFTALPLWLAFMLGRRPSSRRYTYGRGRAEDLAGVIIVLLIFASALLAGYESYLKLIDPTGIDNIGWVMAAAVVGFIGNEAVAIFRIRVGTEIGSAALIADGQHARVDGLTSLAVLGGALGVLAGWEIADPLVGALITVAILFIVRDSAVIVWHRLMDAVDPDVLGQLEHEAEEFVGEHDGVYAVDGIRMRWLGHKLQAEMNLHVDGDLPTRRSHELVEELRHDLFHELPHLGSIVVHVDPWDEDGSGVHHESTEHHA